MESIESSDDMEFESLNNPKIKGINKTNINIDSFNIEYPELKDNSILFTNFVFNESISFKNVLENIKSSIKIAGKILEKKVENISEQNTENTITLKIDNLFLVNIELKSISNNITQINLLIDITSSNLKNIDIFFITGLINDLEKKGLYFDYNSLNITNNRILNKLQGKISIKSIENLERKDENIHAKLLSKAFSLLAHDILELQEIDKKMTKYSDFISSGNSDEHIVGEYTLLTQSHNQNLDILENKIFEFEKSLIVYRESLSADEQREKISRRVVGRIGDIID